MSDNIQATTRPNRVTGFFADLLNNINTYAQQPDVSMPMGKANPVLSILGNALPIEAASNVLTDLSYGQLPITGTGQTTRLNPSAEELALNMLPFPKTSGKAALAVLGATGVPSEMSQAVIGARFKGFGAIPTEVPGFGKAAEITDKYSTLNEEALKEISAIFGKKNITLKDILDHPSLYRDYPELASYPVKGTGIFQTNLKGAYGDGVLYLQRQFEPTSKSLKEAHSTLLHEVQHAIQELDKMPSGGLTEDFLSKGYAKANLKINELKKSVTSDLEKEVTDKGLPRSTYVDILFNTNKGKEAIDQFPSIKKKADYLSKITKASNEMDNKYTDAFNKYKNYAGEVQSRAVQKRFENPEEYNKPVTQSYDRPIENLIYKDPFASTIK